MTVTGSREALKPCPFCGSDAEIERYGDHSRSTIYTCNSCSCSLETGEEWDHGRQWNTRATPDPAGVTLTLEEIDHVLEQHVACVKHYLHMQIGRPVSPDLISAPEIALNSLQAAILSLIQKSAQPGPLTHPPFNKGNE